MDLRHTWASWYVQNRTPLHVLQELGGWETPAMVKRYAHVAVGHLAPYAGKAGIVVSDDNRAKAPEIAANDNPVGTNWSQQLRA